MLKHNKCWDALIDLLSVRSASTQLMVSRAIQHMDLEQLEKDDVLNLINVVYTTHVHADRGLWPEGPRTAVAKLLKGR